MEGYWGCNLFKKQKQSLDNTLKKAGVWGPRAHFPSGAGGGLPKTLHKEAGVLKMGPLGPSLRH